jgi:TolA-binding protein
MTYQEMALVNIAFCYGQLGDGSNAKKYYQQTISEFPESGMAQAGLNLMNAGNSENTEESSAPHDGSVGNE